MTNRFRTIALWLCAAVLIGCGLIACGAAQLPKSWTYVYHYDETVRVVTSVDVLPCWGDIADCERTTPQRRLATFVVPGQTNPWLSTPQFYWDPSITAPATACASDGNNCTSSSCGAANSGIGPCLTYAGIMAKLGAATTYTWAINAPMVLTALSGQDLNVQREPVSANLISNPMSVALAQSLYTSAVSGAGSVLTINSVPSIATGTTDGGTGVIAGLTAKARASNTPLSFTFPIGAGALNTNVTDGGTGYVYSNLGQLLYNSTRGSYAIAVTGSAFGQPFKFTSNVGGTSLPKPNAASIPTEDDTWANGDSFTLYNLQGMNLTELMTYNGGCLTSQQCGILVDRVGVPFLYPSLGGIDDLTITNFVYITNSDINKLVKVHADGNNTVQQGIVNSFLSGGFSGGSGVFSKGLSDAASVSKGFAIFGGATGSNTTAVRTCVFDGVVLDGDVQIYAPNCRFDSYNYAGAVYLSGTLIGTGGGVLNVGKTSLFANSIYGPGTLDAGEGKIIYKSGAGAAATEFPVSTGGAMNSCGQTLVASVFPASATITANLTLSASQLDTSLGATSGCLTNLGCGGAYCNFGP